MRNKMLAQVQTAVVAMPVAAKVTMTIAIAAILLLTTWITYTTGGVRYAYLHLMYVPVVVGGFVFGVPGGILVGMIAGLLIGPYMPVNTITGEMQLAHNWIYRLAFFAFIGALVGGFTQLLRRHLRELEWLNEHHKDTGLLNLAGLSRQLDAMIRKTSGGEELVVSLTQLNTFLDIQNTFGSEFAMRALDQIIERAKGVVPPGSLIALVQPDRLAAVIKGDAAVQVTRERIEQFIKDSYVVDDVPIHIEANVGIARFPAHGRTAVELLQKASIAMHWASASKSPVRRYDAANDHASRDNLILLGELPDAIARGELQIWHQAKLALATGKVAGTEALLRWKHPQRGMVPPGSFVPQVEETMLINPVTQTVVAAAFADAGRWRAAGHRLRVAVNLSVRNLRDRMLLETLDQNLQINKLDPSDIDLEVTESAVMADPDYCIRLIALLRDRGYGVSIDDFGVGHSSLAYLQKLRVSALKIDQEFVKTLASDANNQKIVRSILHLAKALGLETIAEGIEDAQSLALLRDWGCNYGQGYHIHRPAPPQDFERFLHERTAAARTVQA